MKKTIILLILTLLIIYGFMAYIVINIDKDDNTDINLCKEYAEQKVTASRIGYNGSERQYGIDGVWVNESVLHESCKNGSNS